MKRNFSIPFKGYDGKPIKDDKGQVKNISDVIGLQLFSAGSGGDNIDSAQKLAAYRLSVQMAEHPQEVELTAKDCDLIEQVAERTLVAGAYGQVVDIIEKD